MHSRKTEFSKSLIVSSITSAVENLGTSKAATTSRPDISWTSASLPCVADIISAIDAPACRFVMIEFANEPMVVQSSILVGVATLVFGPGDAFVLAGSVSVTAGADAGLGASVSVMVFCEFASC